LFVGRREAAVPGGAWPGSVNQKSSAEFRISARSQGSNRFQLGVSLASARYVMLNSRNACAENESKRPGNYPVDVPETS
jgi:hypothetical protein